VTRRRKDQSVRLARAHGLFNVVAGAWPILSLRSFEWVYGKKRDVFLQKTLGGLLLSIGWVQLTVGESDHSLILTRRIGIATALTLLAVDLVYVPKGQMRRTYLQDAAMELGWIAAWLRAQG
jgi:hypothetical protein